ncbi:G-type lectin S-receptor-like serine/threonine-protein kinase SD1-13 [Gossypium arboreum]|uniref:G-type lectin S-receptor-like serine/threonine-protein kinase SD1-13 n=1 Tax=Gossypium arboreum TaxID=29729 RepID=UPI0022F17AEC|nr:G-type lectin S-receptor-like serine/threonine-protein kinase SD1-13 [Gossypium arboreum]
MGKTISCSVLLALISCFYLLFATTLDTITPSKSIIDPDVLISQNGVFRLGFFSLANSSNCYIGILYNQVPVQIVVWVANRNSHLKDSFGILNISDDGNLVVSNGKAEVIFSRIGAARDSKVATQQLTLPYSGNLVLSNGEDGASNLWESFEDPSNAFTETMKISTDVKKGRKIYGELDSQGKFTEWKWDAGKGSWINKYSSYQTNCDVYGYCGGIWNM